MKIAFITATRPHAGGMLGYLNNFTYGAKKLGHLGEIISIFETTFQRKKLPQTDKKIGGLLEGRQWLAFIAWQIISLIIFFRFLINYLKRRYDFLYVTDVLCANAIRPLEKLFKIPIVLNPIESVYSMFVSQGIAKPNSWFVKYVTAQEKKAYLNAKAMLCNGLDMQKYFQKIADKDIDIPVIENPVDERVYYIDPTEGRRVKEKYGLQNKFIVLYIGRLSPEKGIIYLLRSIPEILRQQPETNIFIAIGGASGPEKQNLIDYINQNNYQKCARVLGYIEDEDMRGIYNMADVVCAPSVRFEGEAIDYITDKNSDKKAEYTISTCTTTIQEAFACGKPAIGTDIPGNREIIKENIDGLLVPEKDAESLAQAILKLKNNPELLQQLSNQALRSIKERFLPTTVVQFLIDYYTKKFKS